MAEGRTIVFFDLETTGLDIYTCDIIQVAAVFEGRVFNAYAHPDRPLSESATRVTGFTVSPEGLFLRGERVTTVPLEEALASFIDFLRSFSRPVILAAHNARRFDMPVLRRALRRCSLDREFREVVCGFLDTFLLSKSLHRSLLSYSQEFMVKHFLGKSYEAHNAVEDARMLQELYNSWMPTDNAFRRSLVY